MTKTKSDAVASWYFNMKLSRPFKSEELDLNIYPINHINVFISLLGIFEKERLMLPENITIFRGDLGDIELDVIGL